MKENKLFYTLENRLKTYFIHNFHSIKIFFIAFAINLLIYGQKIVYQSFPADDYMRYYGDDNTKLLITNSARWGQALLNDYVFTDALQIMPYLHGIIGIFTFTLMGFLTLYYFKRTKPFELFIGILLISATPMFAHNLFFSTNIATWITLTLGIIGFTMASHKSILFKIIGFLLLVFSIANYQTIIQITSIMILFKVIFSLLEVKKFKEIVQLLLHALYYLLFILLAYITAYMINELFLYYHHWEMVQRLSKASQHHTLSTYLRRLSTLYTSIVDFHYFKSTFISLYSATAIVAFISILIIRIKNPAYIYVKVLSLFLLALLFWSIPIIVNLPLLMGLDIPPRAHFTIGWVLTGFFLLQMSMYSNIFKRLSILLNFMIIIVSIYYISVFFDAGIRQTTSDIRRANMIVERIRMQKNYTKEPLELMIIGTRKYNVLGWNLKYEQPFSTHWAKYKIFKYFTDLNFKKMSMKHWQEIQSILIKKGEVYYDYPGKNSIIVYGNKAIVFLNSSEINRDIKVRKSFKNIKNKTADIHSSYHVYLHQGSLYYEKTPCTQKDIQSDFFLRVYPNSFIEDNNAPHYTRDFSFSAYGNIENGSCRAIVPLPNFKIGRIRTGQFERGKQIFWEGNIYKK